MTTHIGILGGTFDPVHIGHLKIAEEVLSILNLDEIRFIPCKHPLLKEGAKATPLQRLEMLSLATSGDKRWVVDEREIKRSTPSFMSETLKSLKRDYPNAILYLILGWDAFSGFLRWHEYQAIFDLAHVIVVNRANIIPQMSDELMAIIHKHLCDDLEDLKKNKFGRMFFLELPNIPISSSEIRENLARHLDVTAWLDESVLRYINKNKLY